MSKVYLRKETRSLWFVKQFINPKYEILIFDNDLFRVMIVNAHYKRTIFLFDIQNWCTTCGNTRSNESLSQKVFHSLLKFIKLNWSILFGGIKMVWVFGSKSILKTTSFLRRMPRKSSINTFSYSFTTRTNSSFGYLNLESLT